MAVDSKLGETKLGMGTGSVPTTPATVANAAASAEGSGLKRAKRTSSLMRSASSLPKVEHSLDEFIARANQTLVDVSNWGTADQNVKEEEEKRREQDAQRWKQAEAQMRESEAREQSLRRQLDGLQGKLAEAEARAAVAMSASSSGGMSAAAVAKHDQQIEELKAQVAAANQKVRAAEQRSSQLGQELEMAKTQAVAHTAVDAPAMFGGETDAEAEERIRLAEAKAAKALAAARAAAAGLTVSSADLAAIESGLVVPPQPTRRTPWIAIMLAFAGGLAIMFVIWKFALSGGGGKEAAATPTQPTQPTQPAPSESAAPPPSAPAQPTVTPIDETPTPAPAAATNDDKASDDTAAAKPATEDNAATDKTADDTATDDTATDKAADATPAPAPTPAPVKKTVRPRPHRATRPAVRHVNKKPAATKSPAIADPFATPAPAKKKPAPKKKAGGIVDPFAS